MNSNIQILKASCTEVFLKFTLTGVALSAIWLDIAVFETKILEISFVEITQEVMLFLCATLFFAGINASGKSGFNVLIGGFFACLLMRELDGILDPISHSAWCWPLTVIGVLSVTFAFNEKNRQETLVAFASFARTHTFGTMTTGLSVLVFSRVFGMGSFWHLVLDDGYVRLAKTTVEEGIELLTYSMWLASSIEYFANTQTIRTDTITQKRKLNVHDEHANNYS